MKRIHIRRKKTLIVVGIAIISVAAALIPGVVKKAKYRKYSSASF